MAGGAEHFQVLLVVNAVQRAMTPKRRHDVVDFDCRRSPARAASCGRTDARAAGAGVSEGVLVQARGLVPPVVVPAAGDGEHFRAAQRGCPRHHVAVVRVPPIQAFIRAPLAPARGQRPGAAKTPSFGLVQGRADGCVDAGVRGGHLRSLRVAWWCERGSASGGPAQANRCARCSGPRCCRAPSRQRGWYSAPCRPAGRRNTAFPAAPASSNRAG